jgi:hypothetical protein
MSYGPDYTDQSRPSFAYVEARQIQRTKRANIRKHRPCTVARTAWLVSLTVLEASDMVLRLVAIQSMPQCAQRFWVKRKLTARLIAQMDREAGGKGEAMQIEWRRCDVCSRLLIGPEATKYRISMRMVPRYWDFPNIGQSCGPDCKPKRNRKIKQTLN